MPKRKLGGAINPTALLDVQRAHEDGYHTEHDYHTGHGRKVDPSGYWAEYGCPKCLRENGGYYTARPHGGAIDPAAVLDLQDAHDKGYHADGYWEGCPRCLRENGRYYTIHLKKTSRMG